VSLLTAFASAAASLIMAYTKKGPDEFGCTLGKNALSEPIFWCTREMAGCNALAAVKLVYDRAGIHEYTYPYAVDLSCTELVSLNSFCC
jgi:hypothetical protein